MACTCTNAVLHHLHLFLPQPLFRALLQPSLLFGLMLAAAANTSPLLI